MEEARWTGKFLNEGGAHNGAAGNGKRGNTANPELGNACKCSDRSTWSQASLPRWGGVCGAYGQAQQQSRAAGLNRGPGGGATEGAGAGLGKK